MIFWVLLITYGNCEAFIDNNEVSINLGVRTYPFGGLVDAQLKSEKLLWDAREKTPWMFSMVQSKLTLATQGLAEASLSVFPVGFIELGFNGSTTSRFYDSKNFDCSAVVCRGILNRTSVFGRMIFGLQLAWGDPFILFSKSQTIAKTADDTKPFVDELEKILGKAGSDELEAKSLGVGFKFKNGSALLALGRQARYQDTGDRNEMAYLIYRSKFDSYKVSAGLGKYQSNRFDHDFSAVLGISFAEGDSASLF